MSAEFENNIKIHFEMLCTPEIRAHAFASEEHDLDFQVFRVLSGYSMALAEIEKLGQEVKDLRNFVAGMVGG